MSSLRKPLSAFISLLAVASFGVFGTAGCQTEAFCWDKCPGDVATGGSSGTETGGGGGAGGSGQGGDGGCIFGCTTSSSSGQGGAGACEKTNDGVEICDTVDNDCNGTVDDVDAAELAKVTSCGSCANDCTQTLLNAKGITCDNGVCKADGCANGYWDLSNPKDYICEYYCVKTADDDSLCNNKDDDCDNLKDEDVDLCTSVSDCGSCGNNCVVLNGTAGCETTATTGQACTPANTKCTVAACEPGWNDLDGSYATGCEYQCTPNAATNGVEVCNGVDDDCDGKIDAADDLSGDTNWHVPCWGDPKGVCGLQANAGQSECVAAAIQCVGQNVIVPGQNQETCNGQDDDCNGLVDDNPKDVNTFCGMNNTYPCQFGKNQCVSGALVCVGAINPTPETCDNKDNDCDGVIDDNPTDVGTVCGETDVGPCQKGILKCVAGGAKVCDGEIAPKSETCNNVDDNCDGMIDNVAGAGAQCGQTDVGPCMFGTLQCVGTSLTCVGAVEPTTETCNNIDDNCNGSTDENLPPQQCVPAGTNPNLVYGGLSKCKRGTQACGGPCVGFIGPDATDTCNGLDDNCDGIVDNIVSMPCDVPTPPPMGATSPCMAGTTACTAGVPTCNGSVVASPTTPDACGVDSNCDGQLTGQPNLQNDVFNCGTCGNNCTANVQHENVACVNGMCAFQGCKANYYDLNNDQICEYYCQYKQAQEACNGEDDNCDGNIDEDTALTKPAPSQIAACKVSPTATRPECTTQVTVACIGGAWTCSFPAGVCGGANGCSDDDELCDSLDNDCDGNVNELWSNWNQPCASDDANPNPGDGACRTTGNFVCVTPTATACNAFKANCGNLAGGCEEKCDGIDNDCDGLIDEAKNQPGTEATYYVKPAVTKIAANRWIFSYEASRPNATVSTPGIGNGYHSSAPAGVTLDKTRACSVPEKLPWFNVTPSEVEQTCLAMGGSICATPDWTSACQATQPCTWGYNPRGATCASTYTSTKFCNLGPSYDFDAAVMGDQDGLLPTGSALLQNCWSDWSGLQGNVAATNRIYDLTGNIREITRSAPGVYPLMGGAFNSEQVGGSTCSFSFYTTIPKAGEPEFQLFDLGFRCCFSTDPT